MFDSRRSLTPSSSTAASAVTIDGAKYSCLSWAGHDSPALVAIHGLGDAPDSFTKLGEDPRRTGPLVSFSLRGSGGTDPVPRSAQYSAATMAEDVARVLEHFTIGRAVLIGASFGGLPAIQFAAAHPERISGLVLVDSVPTVDSKAVDAARRRLSREWRDFDGILGDFARSNGVERDVATALLSTRARREFGAWRYLVDPPLLELLTTDFCEGFVEEARRVRCPVLCLRSELQSVISGKAWEDVHAVLPGAQVEVIPGSMHSIMRSAPVAFNDSVFSFLQRLRPTS